MHQYPLSQLILRMVDMTLHIQRVVWGLASRAAKEILCTWCEWVAIYSLDCGSTILFGPCLTGLTCECISDISCGPILQFYWGVL